MEFLENGELALLHVPCQLFISRSPRCFLFPSYKIDCQFCSLKLIQSGADLGFSRGGRAKFQKNFENFDDLFFQVDQIDFPSSLRAVKRPCFGQIFCAAGNFLKTQVKKAVFGHFLENFDKKKRVFLARAPPQN